jgi:hypothetical protein
MQEYTINAQYTIYVNHPKKTLKGDFATSQGGLSGSSPLRLDGSQDNRMEGWTLCKAAKGTQVLASSRWPSGSSPLRSYGSRYGQAGGWTSERWLKMLNGELENDSRKSRDLVKNRRSDSLKKSQLTLGKMKKGDDAADDKDDDAIRTSASQDRVTARHLQS